MSEENQDYQESENTDQEQGNSEEQSEQQSSEESSEKDYSELYENQKTRAEKAEAKLKELRAQLSDDSNEESEEQTSKKQDLPETPSAEELRLIAQKGYDDDELDKLRKIAQVEEVSLSEAANSDIFSSWKQSRDDQKKNEAAQMGGSQGSGRQTQEKSVSDPNLSEEEHKRLWQQQMGR